MYEVHVHHSTVPFRQKKALQEKNKKRKDENELVPTYIYWGRKARKPSQAIFFTSN